MTTNLVEIFKAGKPRTDSSGRGYDAEQVEVMLSEAAETYDPKVHRAPFLEGHDESRPNQGLVKRVLRIGQSLFAEPFDVNEGFKNEINSGGWPALSSAFYSPDDGRNPTPGKWSLRHVAAVQIPAVKGMAAPQFGEVPDDCVAFAFMEPQVMPFDLSYLAESMGSVLSGVRDLLVEMFGAEKVANVLPVYQVDSFKQIAEEMRQREVAAADAELPPDFSEGDTKTMADELTPEQQQREADLDTREAAIALREKDAEAAEFGAFCEGLLKEGKQFDKTAAIATYLALPDEPVQFGEVNQSPRKTYKDQLAALPKVVEFGEVAGANGEPIERSALDLATEARKLVNEAKGRGEDITFTEAVNQIEGAA